MQGKRGFMSLIKQTQKKGSDIYGFGSYIRAKEPKYWNKHIRTDEEWRRLFKDMTFDIHVVFKIRRVGMKAK